MRDKAQPKASPSIPSSSAPVVSSPAATGGAGTFFEQHVNAYWLVQLLVGAIPPILHDCSVVEVCLQTEVLGWHTDDFLIVGESAPGRQRKLAGQVKRSFTVSATDDECKKTFQDFWADFKDAGRFDPATDRFALVTLRGTNTLLEYFAGLLDAARAARDVTEFEGRLATKGILNAHSIKHARAIRTIVGAVEGRSVSVGELWPFLRVLHVLSLDLNTATQQTEGSMKTLLALTAGGGDAIGAATDSWNALLREVGDGMPTARRFRLGDLPDSLRKRHAMVGGAEQQALRAIGHHSSLILDGIRSTLGTGLHLARAGLVQQVIQEVAASQIVLVSGAAGSGKSTVAKDVAKSFEADHFVFAFRAEEFATPHFDDTLSRSQVPASAALLAAILASQGRKVLFVESVERLLEASTRDAFTDLLTLVAKDPTWRVVLTCRDYSAELVRTAFLGGAAGGSVVRVPPLDDDELRIVETANPSLAHPLSSATLRRLLRNPYVLDKALQVSWSTKDPLPESEREFRRRVWRDIVRADHQGAAGTPQRRENAFVQVALRRARALTLYAHCPDLDAEAIGALRRDSLVVSSEGTAVLLAPAHDVLEDWAILQWIDEQHAVADGSVRALSSALGTHPAVRRTYRNWLAELVDRDNDAADQLFRSVIQDGTLPAHFRDDTIIALLRSSSAPAFLEMHASDLLADDKRLLRLMIRLLRVGCVDSPSWLAGAGAAPSVLSVPEGPAWACLLRLVAKALDSFKPVERGLLLGFVEDWARGVDRQTPYPDGADAAVAIAHWLLPSFEGYRSDEQRKRTLRVIAKLPLADRDRFSALLQGDRKRGKRDRASEDFQKIVLSGVEGMPPARDMPDEVITAATSYLLRTDPDDDPYEHSGLRLEPLFGINDALPGDFFPASAYRGPFAALMMHHPQKALAFMLHVFNHSADWYAHPRARSSIEEPFEVTLIFSDGTSKTQWCNGRLWGWYRGMSVGPYALQSLLMAMEHGLLERAKARPGEMDAILVDILRKSDSAAITAVVASIATALPGVCEETVLVLLSCQTYIQLDRSRLSRESLPPSRMNGVLPMLPMLPSRGEDKLYEHERVTADARPHRKHDLELAVLNLQSGPLAPRIQLALDRHRAALPPPEKQDEGDRVWRLALHRMDARRYKATEHTPPEPSADTASEPAAKTGFVRLDLDVPESDVKEMVDEAAAHLEEMNARSSLQMWGLKVFNREPGNYDPAEWQQRLEEATAVATSEPDSEFNWGRGGAGLVAAVCLRDRWEEMTAEHRNWCVDTVCSEVENGDQWTQLTRAQWNSMSADRACATVIPLLAGKHLDPSRSERARKCLVLALTHAVDEVRTHAAAGIGWHLWLIDRDLALRCVRALAAEALLVQQGFDAESTRRAQFEEPSDEKPRSFDEIEAEAASSIRELFLEDAGIAEDADTSLDPTTSFGAEANSRILSILEAAPGEPAATDALERLAHTLVAWWDSDDDRRSSHHHRRERNFETEYAQARALQRFVLRTSLASASTILQPILDAVGRHPKEAGKILEGLIYANDSNPNTPQFWSLWSLFADRVRVANWLSRIDGEYGQGEELLSALFLGIHWKDGVRHWHALEGHERKVHDLFDGLSPSPTVLEKYLGLLYHVGEQSLPEAFIRVAARLKSGEPRDLLASANSIFMLEVLLQRYVYGRPLELKGRRELREAVLFLLDQLVEAVSSAAFRMRDDFVTPVSTS